MTPDREKTLGELAACVGHQPWGQLCALRQVLLRTFGYQVGTLEGDERNAVQDIIDAVHDDNNPRHPSREKRQA